MELPCINKVIQSYPRAPINVKPLTKRSGGGGISWSGDFIVIVGPGVDLLTGLALPREGIFEPVFRRAS